VYTCETFDYNGKDISPPTPPHSNGGMSATTRNGIIGGVLGGVAVITLALIYWWWKKRYAAKKELQRQQTITYRPQPRNRAPASGEGDVTEVELNEIASQERVDSGVSRTQNGDEGDHPPTYQRISKSTEVSPTYGESHSWSCKCIRLT
jgi:hypothetical protein